MAPRVTRLISRTVLGPDAGTSAGGRPAGTARVCRDGIPASPPAEVREEIRHAQRALHELEALGREVRFDASEGRVRIELCDGDGNVLREIAPSQAVDVAGWARWVE
jgi:hypothetical protein